MTFRRRHFRHRGARISYSVNADPGALEGAEDVLLFNYGLLCSSDHWRRQIAFFDRRGFKVVHHDYRHHHGSSGGESLEDCSFRAIAMDTLALMEDLGVRTCVPLGHSMGASICLEMARIRPEAVSRMVLVSGFLLPPQDALFGSNALELLLPAIEGAMARFPGAFGLLWRHAHLNPLVTEAVRLLGFAPGRVSRRFVRLYVRKVGRLDPGLLVRLLREMRDHDLITEVGDIRPRCLVIGGDADRIVPLRLQALLHRHLGDSELFVVRGGGHVPQYEFPEAVNRRVLEFVRPGARD